MLRLLKWFSEDWRRKKKRHLDWVWVCCRKWSWVYYIWIPCLTLNVLLVARILMWHDWLNLCETCYELESSYAAVYLCHIFICCLFRRLCKSITVLEILNCDQNHTWLHWQFWLLPLNYIKIQMSEVKI